MALDRIVATSSRLETGDLDWEEARRAGLARREGLALAYFADIESQTVMYLRDLLRTDIAADPEAVGFLSVWNYEEYFHGEALAKFLDVCGHPLARDRVHEVRQRARALERVQGVLGSLASRLLSQEFPALYMVWGAAAEFTTLRGYEALERQTKNPVLAEICRRIAKQERRHFAWYFNSARARLSLSPRAQKLTRFALTRFWAPVGAAVKGRGAFLELADALFPGESADALAREVEERMGQLPGLGGLSFFTDYLARGEGVATARAPLHNVA